MVHVKHPLSKKSTKSSLRTKTLTLKACTSLHRCKRLAPIGAVRPSQCQHCWHSYAGTPTSQLDIAVRKNWGSHIDASHSRQPLVKGERLVRYEVNAVMPRECAGTELVLLSAALVTLERSRRTTRKRCRQTWAGVAGRLQRSSIAHKGWAGAWGEHTFARLRTNLDCNTEIYCCCTNDACRPSCVAETRPES